MTTPGELIEALRARGADRFEPVRFRFIEALARRAAVQQGDVRQRLEARLQQLLAQHASAFEQHAVVASQLADESLLHPLAELTERLVRHAGPVQDGAAVELKTLREFRGTWARLSADRRLTQSRAKVPANAGPLNSQHLVHQALSLMRDVSPAYLDRFMAHVDALLWLDQVSAGAAPPVAGTARAEGRKKASSPPRVRAG